MTDSEHVERLRSFPLLSFMIDGELFAVSVAQVREILDRTNTTRIPRMPDFMRGALNVRGAVVPVIDLRIKFGLSPTVVTPDTCVVIMEVEVDGESTLLGAMVDAVRDVFEVEAEDIEAAPKMGTKLDTEFIECMARHDEEFVIVLNVNRVLSVDEVIAIRRATAEEQAPKPRRGAKAQSKEPAGE